MWSNPVRLPSIFSTDQLTRLHDEALRVLKTIGIKVADGELRDRLSHHSGITFTEDRARNDRSLADDMVDEHRRRISAQAAAGGTFLSHEQTLMQ